MRKYLPLIYLASAIVAASPLLYHLSEKIKRRSGFCVSCHINSSTPLHAEKNRLFMEADPVNMSGAHRVKSKGFQCPDCHTGRTLGLKIRIFYLETYNTVAHTLVESREPKRLDLTLMPDDNCIVCHKKFLPSKITFHGLNSHSTPFPTLCVTCHSSHKKGRGDYYFLNTKTLKEACKNCHPRLSEAFTKILKP